MPSRPLEPGAVIARALEIYREQAGVLIPAALALFAVQAVLSVALGGALGVFVSVLSLILATFYQGMVVELVRDVQDGRLDSSVGQLFSAVGPVAVNLLAVSILAGIGILIGFVLLILPGLWLMTIWAVIAPAVVVERAGVIGAFKRSQELVRGNAIPVFTVVLVVVVGLAIVSALAAILTTGLGDVASALVSWLVTALTAPLSAVTAAVLYFALRELRGEPAVPADAAA
jgi:hypothetical protein